MEVVNTNIKIRRGQTGDEAQLARVHIQAWQEAYVGILSQSYLDELPKGFEDRVSRWKRNLVHPDLYTWVAEGENGIVGFVLFGQPRDDNREGYIEVGAIYLLASEKKKKIGYSLLFTGFNKMRELGYKKAYCWMLEKNPTVKFYERTGAKFSFREKYDEIGGLKVKELAYEWSDLNITE